MGADISVSRWSAAEVVPCGARECLDMCGCLVALDECIARLAVRIGPAFRRAVMVVVWSIVATCAQAADTRFHFDIPAQPLETALAAYVAVTGVETIYDSELAGARRSTAVKGVLAPDVALRVLLEGTGLSEISVGNAFAVVDAPRGQHYGGARLSEFGPYYSHLQSGFARIFCRHAETVPGDFRAIIRFSIGSAGELRNLRLLNATGDLRRDAIIADELRGMVFDPPPARMPQPVTMMIAPRAAARTGDCVVGLGGPGGDPRMVRP